MAWETIPLKTPETKKSLGRKNAHWKCPKCEGKPYTIPYRYGVSKEGTLIKFLDDVADFRVLVCDRCGECIAFDGCSGECSHCPECKCETCGKYYCCHCGVTIKIHAEDGIIELHYCNDDVPEWYLNR